MTSTEEAREQIAQVVVTLRAFTIASGAFAAVLLLDQGEETPPLLVECPAVGLVGLSEGETTVELDAGRLAAVAAAASRGARAAAVRRRRACAPRSRPRSAASSTMRVPCGSWSMPSRAAASSP